MLSAVEVAVASLVRSSASLASSGQGEGLEVDVVSFLDRYKNLFKQAGFDFQSLEAAAGSNTSSAPEALAISSGRAYAGTEGIGKRRPLQPIFSSVLLEGVSSPSSALIYEAAPFVQGGTYPTVGSRTVEGAYDALPKHFRTRFLALDGLGLDAPALLSNLLGFLQEVGWCIPVQDVAGVSLVEHARLSAAISVALWAHHTASGEAPSVDMLRDTSTPAFLLVLGDMSGIQGHIYGIKRAQTGTGALAKRLRARSLEVSLSAEAMLREVLASLALPITQRIMSAGGKFYLLLPNTDEAKDVLVKTRENWERRSLAEGGTLLPFLASHAFSAGGFQDFGAVLQNVQRALAEAKLKPLSSQLGSPYLFEGSTKRPCAAYGVVPAQKDEERSVSKQAQRDEDIGRQLPRYNALTFTELASVASERSGYRFPVSGVRLGAESGELLRSTFDFSPHAQPWEVRPLLGHLPTVKDALRALGKDVQEYEDWLTGEGLGRELEEEADERRELRRDAPLTFGELAALSEGVPLLGALMLDADRMGEVFARGFKNPAIAQLATLSRALETFFAAEVAALIASPETYAERLRWEEQTDWKTRHYPLIYSVYAGGDDLFLLGPWDALLAFAQDISELYSLYTKHPAFTLSGGFALVRPHLPMIQLSEVLGGLEGAAKNANKEALQDGRPTGHLALFDSVVSWSELVGLRSWADKLRADFAAGRVSRAQAYRWLHLYEDYRRAEAAGDRAEAMRYKPLLRYALRPQSSAARELYENYQELLNHEHLAWKYLRVWVQWALYSERGR